MPRSSAPPSAGPSGLLLLLSLGLGFACQERSRPPYERGQGTFQRACGSCHGLNESHPAPPGFKVKPPNLGDRARLARLSDDQIRGIIREGKGQMPPFGKMLTAEEVSDLLLYLRSRGQSSPAAP